MEGRCERHPFDQAVDLCGRCGCEFCADCVVYSFGPAKPPYCLPCAVEAAGVRQGAGFRPAPSRKERKELKRRRDAFLRTRGDADVPGEPEVEVPEAEPASSFWDKAPDWTSQATAH